jgi:hypothetical protein
MFCRYAGLLVETEGLKAQLAREGEALSEALRNNEKLQQGELLNYMLLILKLTINPIICIYVCMYVCMYVGMHHTVFLFYLFHFLSEEMRVRAWR